jgi:hypothetical protein
MIVLEAEAEPKGWPAFIGDRPEPNGIHSCCDIQSHLCSFESSELDIFNENPYHADHTDEPPTIEAVGDLGSWLEDLLHSNHPLGRVGGL